MDDNLNNDMKRFAGHNDVHVLAGGLPPLF
jgi:hypothetical protein